MERAVVLLLTAVLALCSSSAQGAAVSFGPATTIAGDTDVLSIGTTVYAYNFMSAQTLNGVSFTMPVSLAMATNYPSITAGNVLASPAVGASLNFFSGFNSTANPFNALSAGYRSVLGGGIYVPGSVAQMNVSLGGLTSGKAYALQVWVSDPRAACSYRKDSISGGSNTITLLYGTAGVEGSLGQYTIGEFVADATSQTVALNGIATSGYANGDATQLNALQVRDVTGIWTGAVNGNLDASSANFAGKQAFTGALAAPTLLFGDKNLLGQQITNGSLTLQASGATYGGVLSFQSSALNYTLGTAAGGLGIGGTASLVKGGTSTLILGGSHSFTGGISVTAGTLKAASVGALASGSINLAAGTRLDLQGNSQSVGAVVNNGSIVNTGTIATLMTKGYSGTGTISGTLNVGIASQATALALTNAFSHTGDVILKADGSGVLTVSGVLGNAGMIWNSGAGSTGNLAPIAGAAPTTGTTVINSSIGAGVTKVIQDSPTSVLVLNASNTAYTGPVEIRQGILALASPGKDLFYNSNAPDIAGKGIITLGTGTANAALAYAAGFGGGGGGNSTITNRIEVSGSATNIIGNLDNSLTVAGTVNLNSASVTLTNTNPGSVLGVYQTLKLSGGVTGTGDVFVTNSSGTGATKVVFDTLPVNNLGNITFNSAALFGGSAGTDKSAVNSITGGVGANVLSVIQDSPNNDLSIATGSITVGSAGKSLVVSGLANFAVTSPIAGAGNLTLQNDDAGLLNLSGALSVAGTLTHKGAGSSGSFYTSSGTGPAAAVLATAIPASVTRLVQDSPASALVLNASSPAFTAPIEVRQGPLVVANNAGNLSSILGSGTILLGTGSGNASLLYAARYGNAGGSGIGGNYTLVNPIAVGGTGMSMIAVTDWGLTLSGALTLANDLTFTNANANGSAITVSNSITGTGNITYSNSSAAGSSTFSVSGLLNPAGSVTFNNAALLGGVAGTGTGTNTVSGGVGPAVTAIVQNSNSNPLTISTGSVNVNPAGLTITSNGSALVTVSAPTTGTGLLTLNLNGSGGITVTGAFGHTGGLAVNRAGSGALSLPSTVLNGPVTFSGGSTTAFTITSGFSASNTSIVQASNTSALTISTGSVTVGASGKTIISSGSAALTIASPVSGTGNVVLQNNAQGIMTFSGGLSVAGTITNSGLANSGSFSSTAGTTPGSVLISSALGSTVTRLVQDSPASALVLNASNTALAAPIEIRQGPLVLANNAGTLSSILGSGTILLGTGSSDASLVFAGRFGIPGATTGGAVYTLTNPIVVGGSGNAMVVVSDWGLTLGGPVTLANSLSLVSANSNGSSITTGSLISGTGNLSFINASGPGATNFAVNGLLNNAGSVTFNSAALLGGSIGSGTLTNTVSGGIGSAVTAVVQGSNSNPLVISTGSVNVNPAGLAITSNGSALLTVSSPTTGTGVLTLNVNGAGGITFTGAFGHTGGLTINRSGAGTLSIPASALTGAVTFGGTTTTPYAFNSGFAASNTSITQASNTSALTIATGTVTVGTSGKTIVSSGSAAMTVSSLVSGTGNVVLQNNAQGIMTFSGGLSVAGTITNSGLANSGTFATSAGTGPGAVVISSALGSTVTRLVQDSPASALVLNASSPSFAAPIEVRQGPLVLANNAGNLSAILGTGNILLGTGSGDAQLIFAARYGLPGAISGGGAYTLINPITVGGSGSCIIAATDWSLTLSNAVTLANNVTFAAANAGASYVTTGGAISGTGNVTFSNASGAGLSKFTVNGLLNNSGTVTFNNAALLGGAAGTGNAVNTVVGGIGANVRSIVQSSPTNPLVIQTGSIEVGALGKTLVSNGAASVTVSSAVTGSGSLTLAANSSGALSLSGAFNHAGSIVNAGTGSAMVTISGSLGAGVTEVRQSSATSVLKLTGANANTGAMNVLAGTLDVSTVGALSSASILNVSAGASALLPASPTLGGLSGAGSLTIASGMLTVGGNNASGSYTGSLSGAFGLLKTGTGSLSLTGNHSFTGNAVVSKGALEIAAGSLNLSTSASLLVGDTASQPAVLAMSGGVVAANKGTAPSVDIGGTAGSQGFVKISAGSLYSANEMWLGNGGSNAFGAVSQSGGVVTVQSWIAIGRVGPSAAVYNLSGGSLSAAMAGGGFAIGSAGATTFGVLNVSGGAVQSNGVFYVGENGNGVLNLTGSGSVTANGGLVQANSAGTTGILNLAGGTLTVNGSISKGTGTAVLNFNGGTLRPAASNGAFLSGLNSAFVYGGGALVDTAGQDVTVSQALSAPNGNGVSSAGVTVNGGTGYLDTPLVSISGGGGTGATAIATVANGAVTGIVITNPGVGYTSVPAFSLVGGGGSGASISGGSLVANVGGGLTKSGLGTLTLSGVNTYTGPTNVLSGTLSAQVSGAIPSGSSLNVAPGARVELPAGVTLGSLTGNGSVTASGSLSVGAGGETSVFNGSLAVSGRLLKAGAGTLTLAGTNSITGGVQVAAGTLRVSAAAQLGSGPVTVADGAQLVFDISSDLDLPYAITGSVVVLNPAYRLTWPGGSAGRGPSPQITGNPSVSAVVSRPFSYQLPVLNAPTSFSATGLPPGLTLNSATGVVSGTPSAVGTYTVNWSVSNASGSSTFTQVFAVSTTARRSVAVHFSDSLPGEQLDNSTPKGPLGRAIWNDSGASRMGTKNNLLDDAGAPTPISITWSSANTYRTQSTVPATQNGRITYGYLDDTGISITLSNIPYASYNVYGIVASDYASTPYDTRDFQVNGSIWAFGGASPINAPAYGTWEAAGSKWIRIDPANGQRGNYWRVQNLTGSTVTITGQGYQWPARGSLAAVIIESNEQPDVQGSLSQSASVPLTVDLNTALPLGGTSARTWGLAGLQNGSLFSAPQSGSGISLDSLGNLTVAAVTQAQTRTLWVEAADTTGVLKAGWLEVSQTTPINASRRAVVNALLGQSGPVSVNLAAQTGGTWTFTAGQGSIPSGVSLNSSGLLLVSGTAQGGPVRRSVYVDGTVNGVTQTVEVQLNFVHFVSRRMVDTTKPFRLDLNQTLPAGTQLQGPLNWSFKDGPGAGVSAEVSLSTEGILTRP